MISPSNSFNLVANGLNEIHILIRPTRAGIQNYSVNVVDVENHQLVETWMIKVDTRMPVISKQFGELIKCLKKCSISIVFLAHKIPFGQSQPITKRISYTNPYAIRKTFLFNSSRPDLLQLQHQKLDFQGNEKRFLNFTLLPAFDVQPEVDVIIFINNEQDTNEDAYSIRISYTDSSRNLE